MTGKKKTTTKNVSMHRYINNMRLHRNLVLGILDSLHSTFNEDEYADKVIDKTLKRDQRWGSKERSFIAETTYAVVRLNRLYAETAEVKQAYKREDLWRM